MNKFFVLIVLLVFPIVLFAQNEKELRINAERGDSNAQFELAKFMLESNRHNEAEKWLLKSANQNNEMAQVLLGVYYEMFCEDYGEAMKWYIKAGEQCNGEALFTIGNFYAEGKGVERDDKKAFYYYEKSAECGYTDGLNMMAFALLYGQVGDFIVEKDVYKAVEYFRLSAELGSMVAQRWMGICCLEGIGVAKNSSEAMKWFNMAVEQGDEESKQILEKL